MAKSKQSLKSIALGATCALLAGALVLSPALPMFGNAQTQTQTAQTANPSSIRSVSDVETHREEMFDPAVVQKLPDGLAEDREISVVVKTSDEGLLAAYDSLQSVTRYDSIAAFADSSDGVRVLGDIARRNADARRKLSLSGVKYDLGAEYSTLTGGFEVTVKAGEYAKIVAALQGTEATAYISEEYAVCETQVVENDVNVYETGIFDSSDSEYDGTGTIVAVLDTGLDYTHSAFDPARFMVADEDLAMDLDDVAEDLTSLRAYEFSGPISAADLYINRKVPYGYDYADKDTDVYPLESEHGTHVSGVILGKDDTITGVAPNAQLVAMKVFSDTQQSARWSWILSALEDCITLDVDVINMSLGSSAGFSVESKADEAYVYQNIADHGISLVAAASNDHNSTYGSEKNGNLGLTSNPDSATIGSPGSYTSSLAVASISGVKTSYITFNGRLIYFTEAADTSGEYKSFVDDIFKNYPAGTRDLDLDFVVIRGTGRTADYTNRDVKGKIVVVRRGSNTFEEKARIAQQQGAIGVIIYNNVSGDITMNVGFVSIAVCSISKDDGEAIEQAEEGTIRISRDQIAGPFMSDFSSWGPTPDLRIKPEITAHGGDILSAVPGQAYERLSGTSMASPNQAGVTALIRQYVKDRFNLKGNDAATRVRVLSLVNQIMMSTTDIARNTNGLPYSVRKQGSGLANIAKATSTPAFISTFDRDTGKEMDKAKIELGDDRDKTGVYEFKFNINNALGTGDVSYDAGAIVMTEGVSETKTHKGATTVTEKGYILEGAEVAVVGVENGAQNGNNVTVGAGQTATVTMRITLGDRDKEYLDNSFENGMYVEGYVTLTATAGTDVSLNVPYLAFYGDWTQAPIFDLDYFETQKDELDDSIDTLDKTLPDAYATRPIGGLSEDYISYLGAYYFRQPAGTTMISADRQYISLSNQEDGVNSIYAIWAGMLRGAKRTVITITDASTGEVIFVKEDFNQRKSYNTGAAITFSSVEVDFSAIEYDLKNNTKYNVRLEAYLDYGEDGGATTNKKNVFEFPFVTDFQSPVVTGCEYYTEYDRSAQKNRLFARVSIYDNHYSMAYFTGYMTNNPDYPDKSQYRYESTLLSATPVQIYSGFNSTTDVTIELTDYLSQMKGAVNKNSFIIGVYDYALNEGLYELTIPDSVRALYFNEESITLSPNETYILDPQVYPSTEWKETLEYEVGDESIIRVVGNKILALASGETTLTARSADTGDEETVIAVSIPVKVLFPEEEGYVEYTQPVLNSFRLTGYTTDKAFYVMSSDERDIGTTGSRDTFPPTTQVYALSMYPSEQVTIEYLIDAYYPEKTEVVFTSNNENIVTVSEDGQITAVAEGFGSVSVRVIVDGKTSLYDYTISITVKNPYEQSGMYLMSYRGNGGKVVIPADLGFQQIYQYAFSSYEYIPKDENDEISEEDPSMTKPWYIGENTITEVVIPEGVEVINAYAFAGLTALEKVTFPSTLTKIAQGAFYGCTSLKEIEGLEYVKFINQDAFSAPEGERVPLGKIKLDSIIALGNNAFRRSNLVELTLPETAQSIGAYAFADTMLSNVKINASRVKLGAYAFQNCSYLYSVNLINAYVVPDGLFDGCKNLASVTLGADVSSVGLNAFGGTNLKKFVVAEGNATYKTNEAGTCLLSADGKELKLVAPSITPSAFVLSGVERIGAYAFSGNETVNRVEMRDVVSVGDYAFANTDNLASVTLGQNLTSIGAHSFENSGIRTLPALGSVTEIPAYAFAGTKIVTLNLGDGFVLGEGAFSNCTALLSVSIGKDAKIGERAFYCDSEIEDHNTQIRLPNDTILGYARYYSSDSSLYSVRIGSGAEIGKQAFANANTLSSLTLEGGTVGEEAFYNSNGYSNTGLWSADLSKLTSIGARAFSGDRIMLFQADGDYPLGPSARSQAALFSTIDLGGLVDGEGTQVLGDGAFAYCTELTAVRNFGGVKIVPDNAFHECSLLASIDLSNVTRVGAYAFDYTSLLSADLSHAESIGEGAFMGMAGTEYSDPISLESVTLRAEGLVVGDMAFAGNVNLTEAANLSAVTQFGDYAFSETKLSGVADLTKATVIGSFAFSGADLTGVKLSEGLAEIGQNPFSDCPMPRFGKVTDVLFHDEKVGEEIEYTYDLNDTIKIIDGALYRVVPAGLELICMPKGEAKADGEAEEKLSYVVAENTVRIGAQAFYNVPLVTVEFPQTLRAIGDKAFFGCDLLEIVIFKSLEAPILEEQYDETYLLVSNFPGSVAGYDMERGDLGITDFMLWSPYYTTFFFGSNFDNYIGRAAGDITMIRPENGVNYESFIFGHYFGQVIDGPTAPEQATLDAIAAIAALPDNVALEHEAVIREARRLYDLVATDAQRALVYNYSKLTNAENTLIYLQATPPEEQPEPEDNGPDLALILGIVFGVVGVAIIAGAVTYTVLYFRKKKAEGESAAETAEAEAAEKEAAVAEAPEAEPAAEEEGGKESETPDDRD